MKKLLSLFLALLMVVAVAVTAIPTAIAAGNTTAGAEDAYFKIGDQYYSTFKAALEDAKDGDTIELLKDYTDNSTVSLGTYSADITINGNNHTISMPKNTNKYVFEIRGGATVTINNLVYRGQSGITIAEGTLNLNECDFITTHRMAVRTTDTSTWGVFNIHNTTLEIDSDGNANGAQAEPLVLLQGKEYNVMNITGTSVLKRTTRIATNNDGNCSVINIGGNAENVTINVGSDAEIVLNQDPANTRACGAIGIYKGGDGIAHIVLEAGATIRATTTETPVNFLMSDGDNGLVVVDKGANFLVTESNTGSLTNLINGYTTYTKQATSVESGYTTYKYTPASSTTANEILYINSSNVATKTTSLKAAIDGAKEGTGIVLLGDHTETAVSYSYVIAKKLFINGNGFDLTLNNASGSNFPFAIGLFNNNGTTDNAADDYWNVGTAYLSNFGLVDSVVGGMDVRYGTAYFSYLTFRAKDRVAVKMTGGAGTTSEVIVEQAELCNNVSAAASETVFIFNSAGGKQTLTLKDGAILRRNNPTNTSVNTQAGVIYVDEATSKNGTYIINMEKGSKVITNAATGGKTVGSVIAFGSKVAKMYVNMEEGSYLISESAGITGDFYFIYNRPEGMLKLNAPKNAFLIKDGITNTVKNYTEGYQYGNHACTFSKDATTAVSGYASYTLTRPVDTKVFTYTNVFGEIIPVTESTAFKNIPATATVTLPANATRTTTGLTLASGRNLTINLNGFTYTTTGPNYWVTGNNGTLNIKNGNLVVAAGITNGIGSKMTMDGVTATVNTTVKADGTTAYSRPLIKLSGDKQNAETDVSTVTINNSTLTSLAAEADGQAMIIVEQGINGTVNLTGTTKLIYEGKLPKSAQNTTAISVQQAWGLSDTQDAALANTNAVINIGSDVVITGNHKKHADGNSTYASLICDSTKGTVEVNLDAGATLEMVRTDIQAGSKSYFVYINNATGTTTVNDNGANFVVGKDALAAGVTLPTLTKADVTFLGFGCNDKLYAAGDVVSGTIDTDTVTLSTVYYGAEDFGKVDGASLRTVYKENGIRFSTFISDELLAALGDNVKFGTLVASTKLLNGAELTADLATGADDATALDIKSTQRMADFNDGTKDYENAFHAALIMTPENVDLATVYKTSITARGYMTITYADGATVTVLTDTNVRSMYDVATNLDANGETNRVITDILEKCA